MGRLELLQMTGYKLQDVVVSVPCLDIMTREDLNCYKWLHGYKLQDVVVSLPCLDIMIQEDLNCYKWLVINYKML
jgi:hypothetical protein